MNVPHQCSPDPPHSRYPAESNWLAVGATELVGGRRKEPLYKHHAIIERHGEIQPFDQYAVQFYKDGVVERSETIYACADAEALDRVMSGIMSSTGKLLK